MSGFDTPGLRIEVVGAIADILHRAESDTLVGHSDEAPRGIGRQYEGLAPQIFQGLGVGEVDAWEIALRKIGGEDSKFRVDSG